MTERFTKGHYFPFVYGSGAEKLEDSQIAPLVAAVRGYRSFSIADDEKGTPQARLEAASRFGVSTIIPHAAKSRASLFREAADVMLMPWFAASTVLASDGAIANAITSQIRPEKPRTNADGKAAKYLFPKDGPIPISIHPSITPTWAGSAGRVMITEGVIKEDALLTNLLLSSGITPDELMIPDGAVTVATLDAWRTTMGIQQLRELLERVPEADRIIPVGIGGVNNWDTQRLSSVPMARKDVIIAFDGDVKSNPNVWAQADRLWSAIGERSGHPLLLDLGGAAALAEVQATEKFRDFGKARQGEKTQMVGVDDYLSYVGPFDQMLKHIVDELPPKPADPGAGYRPGEWKVTDDGLSTEEFGRNFGFDGTAGWRETNCRIGGTITSVTVSRAPTLEEVRTGGVIASEDLSVTQVANLQLRWRDEHSGEEKEVAFQIPIAALNSSPHLWKPEIQNSLPPALNMHPDWPPVGQDGVNWLRALKRAAADGWANCRSWEATGYVPGATGEPVYTVGDQVLGATREAEKLTAIGVDEGILPNARDFGVADIWWETVDPDGVGEVTPEGLATFKKQLVNDIETVVRHWIYGGAWTQTAFGMVLLGVSLRTTIPKRPGLPLFIGGTPGSGKSYTAAMCMGAWQKRPGVWTAQHLPGSASSTAFALEKILSIAGAGIWVADDLAPSVSQQSAIQAEAGIEAIVRSTFNDSARQRGSKDGGIAKSAQPRAMLIITAENSVTSTSALERVMELRFDSGTMDNAAAQSLIKESINTLALSRVAAAMIRMWFRPHEWTRGGPALTWDDRMRALDDAHQEMKNTLSVVLEQKFGIEGGASARRVQLISEVMLTLSYLGRLYEWAGGTDERVQGTFIAMSVDGISASDKDAQGQREEWFQRYLQVEQLCREFGADNYMEVLTGLAAEQLKQLGEKKIGASLFTAISNALASGDGHLVNPTQPGAPPFTGDGGAQALNRAVGWEFIRGEWSPRGKPIGAAGLIGGKPSAVLHVANAFKLAQTNYPSLVPYGQKAEGSWQAAMAEGLVDAEGVGPGERSYSGRVRIGQTRVRGVQTTLERLGIISES